MPDITSGFNENSIGETANEERHYTEQEVTEKLTLYKQLSEPGSPDEALMNDLAGSHQELIQERDTATFARGVNFDMGVRAGLHQDANRGEAQNQELHNEQEQRNDIIDKATTHYKEHYSLTKTFQEKSEDIDGPTK